MAHFPVDNQAGRQLDTAQIIGRFAFTARLEAPEAVEPGVADLDHPAPWRMPVRIARRGQRLRCTGLGRDVTGVAMRGRRRPAVGVVVAAIQAQMAFRRVAGRVTGRVTSSRCDRPRRIRQHPRVQQGGQLLPVRAVGARQHGRQGDAFAVRQQVAFDAGFAPVGGVGAGRFSLTSRPFFPPGDRIRQPSAACHSQSPPTVSSYLRSSSAQARSKQPAATHSWNRACTIDVAPKTRGSWDHWLPVRASQISPLKIGRSAWRGRPDFLRDFSMTSNGASVAHTVGSSGLRTGAASVAAGAGVFMPPVYHKRELSGRIVRRDGGGDGP